MAITNIMTFALGFCKKSEKDNADREIKMFEFSVYYDRAQYDEPKDVAINHAIKIKDIDDGTVNFAELLPVFKTFRVINDRVPSDLGMR